MTKESPLIDSYRNFRLVTVILGVLIPISVACCDLWSTHRICDLGFHGHQCSIITVAGQTLWHVGTQEGFESASKSRDPTHNC